MSEKIQVEVFNSIEHIPQESWDSVAGKSAGLNHIMLWCREKNYQGPGEPRYFLAKSFDTVKAVSVAVVHGESIKGELTHRLFGRFSSSMRPMLSLLDRILLCGQIPGSEAAIIIGSDSDRPHWIRIICQAMEDYANARCLHMVYTNVLPEQSALIYELCRRNYLQGVDYPIATLDVRWHDRESYLSCLKTRKKKYFATAKTEIRRFLKSGIRISRWLENDSAPLDELLRKHYETKNVIDYQFKSGFVNDLITHLADDCIVYVARKGEMLVGVCVVIRRNDNARVWLVGIDHTADSQNFTYFNLVFYHLAAEFPSMGIRHAYYGNAVQYTKYRRGCDIVSTRFFVKFKPSVLTLVLWPVFVIQRFVFSRKYFAFLNRKTNSQA